MQAGDKQAVNESKLQARATQGPGETDHDNNQEQAKPTLFVYHLLTFLHNDCVLRNSQVFSISCTGFDITVNDYVTH